MSIAQGTETVSLTSQERTWRTEIFTDKGVDPAIRMHREVVKTDAAGNIVSRDATVAVDRSLSKIASQTFTVGVKSYTGTEIAAVISAIADVWRQEDIASATVAT